MSAFTIKTDVEIEELTEFIGAADLYITPYLNVQQAVSGTLAYAFRIVVRR